MNIVKYKSIRNQNIDFYKGIAIFLVVWGHCIQYIGNKEQDFFYNPVFKFIYSFHMPLFMFISGYLFYNSINKTRDIKGIIISKFKTLIIPIIGWSILVETLFMFIKLISRREFNIFIEIIKTIKGLPFQLWFLWGVFYCSLIVILVSKYLKNSKIVYIIISILLFVTPDVLNSHLYKFMYPYFIVGFFFNDFKDVFYKYRNYIVMGSFLLFPLSLFLWKKDYYIYISRFSVLNTSLIGQLENDMFRYFTGFIGIIFILILLEFYLKYFRIEIINKTISKLGSYSLGIYIISSYIFILVDKLPQTNLNIFVYSVIVTPIISIVLIVTCTILCKLIQKNSVLNRLLLGGRR